MWTCAALITASNDEEAIAVANDTEYGLSAGNVTRNEQRGLYIGRRPHRPALWVTTQAHRHAR
jgi:acyl-CoA reductase-like NAD-dependent aldehyde dehydrogenase